MFYISTFESYTHEGGCHFNKLVIPKIFVEDSIQKKFTVTEISAIAGALESKIYKDLEEYDLETKDFSKVPDNQLGPEVLILTNDYPFCKEFMLRELLKCWGFNVERYCLRDSIHRDNSIHRITFQVR